MLIQAPATYNNDPYASLIFPYMIGSGGGGLWLLGRTSATAYLDAAVLGSYLWTTQQVVDWTNAAFDGGVGSAAYQFALQKFGEAAIENCTLSGISTVEDYDGKNGWGAIKP